MSENRQHKRVSYEVPVTFTLKSGSEEGGNMANISTGGAYIQSDSEPGFGDKMTLCMQLPNVSEVSSVPCIVRWVKPGDGFGVQFEQLRPIEVWGLNKFLRTAS